MPASFRHLKKDRRRKQAVTGHDGPPLSSLSPRREKGGFYFQGFQGHDMPKTIIDRPYQIIAAGDSLTSGLQPGISEYAPFAGPGTSELLNTAYPYILSELLSARFGPRLVRNLARSGSTTRDWLPGCTWKRRGIPGFPLNGRPLDEITAMREPPRVCLMMLGTNDVNSSVLPDFLVRRINGVVGYENRDFIPTRENLIIILSRLKERGVLTYLAKIPPNRYRGGVYFLSPDRIFYLSRKTQQRLENYTRRVNERIEEILVSYPGLARRGPDFYSLFSDRDDIWSWDRLHLNTQGYRFMAWAWAQLLRREGVDIRA